MSTKDEHFLVEGILARMREATGSKNDAQLAAYLGVARSVVSAWKTRGTIPYASCGQIHERESVSMDWLLAGKSTVLPDVYADIPDKAKKILELVLGMDEEQQDQILRRVLDQKRAAEKERLMRELQEEVARLKAVYGMR